ncbi:hypothetical protein [Pontibacter mucosus]|uniref:hypothetical protein n=1 Tax=Pontibacter mucosus TaxID=1649266 RepID=UPI001FE686CB|nr:hypothetical protein [Pontibacter mucosus]
MSTIYFAVGFIGTVAAAQFSLFNDRNLVKALLIGLAVGVVLYLASVIYVYNKVEFE